MPVFVSIVFSVRQLGMLALIVANLVMMGAAIAATGAKEFAFATHIKGEVIALGTDDIGERKLRIGAPVYVGERVQASASGEAVLKTKDAGYIAIRPNAEFVAESFAADGKPTDHFAVRLISGSLRVISGWIARLNRAEHKILTNTATIGIRGTDHEPYVLTREMAFATGSKEGTYDKVNRGGTTLDTNGNQLDIDPGRVGFAPKQVRQRALMTLLLPVLLDKVPDFYVPGEFDTELDRLSQVADSDSQELLNQKLNASKNPPVAECSPKKVAKTWLKQLDAAIGRGDSATITAMFAPEITVKATIRTHSGSMTDLEFSREEFIESTTSAVKSLVDYKQRRISIDAKSQSAGTTCGPVRVKTVVIEQGKLSGKPYRFESLEDYILEWRGNAWLATMAETTQR